MPFSITSVIISSKLTTVVLTPLSATRFVSITCSSFWLVCVPSINGNYLNPLVITVLIESNHVSVLARAAVSLTVKLVSCLVAPGPVCNEANAVLVII